MKTDDLTIELINLADSLSKALDHVNELRGFHMAEQYLTEEKRKSAEKKTYVLEFSDDDGEA